MATTLDPTLRVSCWRCDFVGTLKSYQSVAELAGLRETEIDVRQFNERRAEPRGFNNVVAPPARDSDGKDVKIGETHFGDLGEAAGLFIGDAEEQARKCDEKIIELSRSISEQHARRDQILELAKQVREMVDNADQAVAEPKEDVDDAE